MLSNGDYNLYVNHRLLGGSREYLEKIKKVAYYISNITPQGALRYLDIDDQKYREVDNDTLMKVIRSIIQAVLKKLSNDSLSIDRINRHNLERAIDTEIFYKQKKLINANSYDLLFPFKRGLDSLGNKIFNKDDPFTVHAVKCFFNSINEVPQNESWIESKLKDRRFVCHIYINLIAKFTQAVNEQFIKNFTQFQVQVKPTQNEYTQHGIPKAGFCHGSCITIANLNSFDNRNEILEKSVFLQQEYHKVRNPSEQDMVNEYILQVTDAVHKLPISEKPPYESLRTAIKRNLYDKEAPKNRTQIFLEQNVDLSTIAIQSRIVAQEKALIKASTELKIFDGAETILDDIILSLTSFNYILEYLNKEISASTANSQKHMVLITLREKADMSKATKIIQNKDFVFPQNHDILLKVDTNNTGNISKIIFSDLQETGLHIINATNNAKIIKDANPKSIELVKFYVKNSAINRFDKIGAKYIARSTV